MTWTTNETQTGNTTTHAGNGRASLEERLILLESELNIAKTHMNSNPELTFLHLERAKNELQQALYYAWHKFHVSGEKR